MLNSGDQIKVSATDGDGQILTVSYIEPELASPRDAVPHYMELAKAAQQAHAILNHTTDRNIPGSA